MALVSETPRVAQSYVVYFGDIYLTNARLLPDFDIVTMFHLCEFAQPNTTSSEYGGLTDRALLDAMTAKKRSGGYILFYRDSHGRDATQAMLPRWQREQPVERVEDFKT